MMTKTVNGETFTKVDEETWVNETGGEWVAWEREDMESKLKALRNELAGINVFEGMDYDTAERFLSIQEQINTEEEDLEIMNALF